MNFKYTKVLMYFGLTCLGIIGTNCEKSSNKNSSLKQSNGNSDFMSFLQPISIKRVSGSNGNKAVRNFISTKMKSFGWIVEEHKFSDRTPYGEIQFVNLIASNPIGSNFFNKQLKTSDLSQQKRIVFACHYDSKYVSQFEFIGATDSAVPCAILLDLAHFMKQNFYNDQFKKLNKHIQFIFFDGEEAFKYWTNTDSLYGSRNYARMLQAEYGQRSFSTIDLFILLDLIGGNSAQIPNYFPRQTSSYYNALSRIETNLRNKNKLSTTKPYYFTDLKGYGQGNQVDDDHIPFLNKNVPILHLIPSPFPSQWHTYKDNLANLNKNTVEDMRLILKYFLSELLQVNAINF